MKLTLAKKKRSVLNSGLKKTTTSSGVVMWHLNGRPHSPWGLKPAISQPDGCEDWYKKGFRHRAGDKPAMIRPWGEMEWWIDGKLHREGDKPARILPTKRQWWVDGELHRDGGLPAVEYGDGSREWWENGKRIVRWS